MPLAPRISVTAPGGRVGPAHHVRGQHREQGVEVASARGGKEGVDHPPVPGEHGGWNLRRAANAVACAAGELLRGHR
ncbi:MAG: hypothetical protein ACRDRO_03210 [Pseudonocardiaceae bacterium]